MATAIAKQISETSGEPPAFRGTSWEDNLRSEMLSRMAFRIECAVLPSYADFAIPR